jgi:hypothetical protein
MPTKDYVLGQLERKDEWNIPTYTAHIAIDPYNNRIRDAYEQNIVPSGADIRY